MDFAEQHADDPSAPQGTNALHMVADIHADDARHIQALHEGAYYVRTEFGPDGELSMLPLCAASPTVAAMSLQPQPTTNAVDEVTDNEDKMLGMPTKEKSSMDRGNAHSLCVPKKRKIVSESSQELVEAKHQLISSAHQNHSIKKPFIVFRDNYMTNFSTTVEDGFVSSTGFAECGSSYRPTSDSAMARMNPPQQINETWYSGQGRIALPDSVQRPYLLNFPDSARLPEPVQYTGQQQPGLNLTSLSTEQQFDLPMNQIRQSISGLEMSLQDTTSSANSYVSQENASNGPSPPPAQKFGEIRIYEATNIKDIAALNGKVYISYKDNDTLFIYNSTKPSRKQTEVKVNGMKHPRCMAASAEMNCLFISDGESAASNCVWMVKDGGEAVCKKFMEGVECSSLSVTRNGELLIVDSKHKCIHLYDSNGRCFSCIRLPSEIKCPEPLFVVKSLEESFYVSSVWTREYDKRETIISMVYKVSMAGDIVKTFGGRAGLGSGQLSGSNVTLAVDRYGRVIVCDGGNRRVLMLDSNLQSLTTVLDNCDLWRHRNGIIHMDTNSDLIFHLNGYMWKRYINMWSLSQFQPNLMPNSSSSISSKAITGAAEFHLLCSINNKEVLGMDMFSFSWSIKNKKLKRKLVRGVATLTDSIYVLTECGIVVFDCRNPYKMKYYKINIGKDLCDIAVDVTDGRLYVADRQTKCVLSVGIDLRRKTWLEGIGSPYTLSVAKDGSILILSNKDQNLGIYNKNGLHQKVTVSHNRKLHLRHAIQLSDARGKETYLVCHGHGMNQDEIDDYDYDIDFLSNEVFVVSANGNILLAFGGRFGSETDQLNVPSYMSLDRDGTILVADCKNNRVLRLDHQLKRQNISLSKDVHGIEEPLRLCFSENTGQVIVANSNSVDIFVHDNVLRCQNQADHSSNSAASTDAYEPETPDVQLIGQIDSQLQKDKDCIGAAVLQDKIYLIYDDVNVVYVHSSVPPYSLLGQVGMENVRCMEYLSSIVASVEHNCVYIARFEKILRLLRNGEQCETYLDDISVESISVTEKGHLLVVTYSWTLEFESFGIYNADGKCIQVIVLQEVFDIQHAVQLTATNIFVSCLVKSDDESNTCRTLKKVSHNGAILHTYGPYFSECFECGGMTAGGGDEIFVIDKANGGRVLVFGSEARLFGILLSSNDHHVGEITGLCYIKDKMQLIVTGSDHIGIYQLKNRERQMDEHERNMNDPVLCSRQGNSDQLLWARTDLVDNDDDDDDDDTPRAVEQLDDDDTPRAVEQLGDKLYLLSSTYLAVYPRQDFVDKANLQYGALKIPMDRSCSSGLWDMAASETDLCLYVTDRYNSCVWSVTIDHKTKKWLTGIGSPYTLSVTEERYLCILSNTYRSLDIYDRSGNKKHSIRLPREMKHLLHAVQTPKGTYVISWTWNDGIRQNGDDSVDKNSNANKDQRNQNDGADDDDDDDNDDVDDDGDDDDNDDGDDDGDDDKVEKKEAQKVSDDEDVVFEERYHNGLHSDDSETQKLGLVCEVSSDGSVLRSFSANDSEPNRINISDSRPFHQLYKPCHLAVDNDGRLFVADYDRSGRVLLLDSQLKFVANLTEKYPLQGYKAKRLCYDKKRKELIAFHLQKDSGGRYRPSLICIRV